MRPLACPAANGLPRENFRTSRVASRCCLFSPRQTPCQPRPLSSRPCNALPEANFVRDKAGSSVPIEARTIASVSASSRPKKLRKRGGWSSRAFHFKMLPCAERCNRYNWLSCMSCRCWDTGEMSKQGTRALGRRKEKPDGVLNNSFSLLHCGWPTRRRP